MSRPVGGNTNKNATDKDILASFVYGFTGGNVAGSSNSTLRDLTVREITLAESLLTPGLQTSIKFHSGIHIPEKNYDDFRNSEINLKIERPVLADWNFQSVLNVQQRVYRLSNRKLFNNNVEEFTLHACDDSLLNDARNLVSKTWPCGTSPSNIVSDVLSKCVKVPANRLQVEPSGPPRTYVAENIHPFQIINEVSNIALFDYHDPSFLHYMTYENLGTHHFKSLSSLIQQSEVAKFTYAEIGAASGYAIPTNVMTYSFPCDYDLLSDILNGIDVDGTFLNSILAYNPFTKMFSLYGNKATDCGMGGGNIIYPTTNLGSADSQYTCNTDVEQFLLKRQARMNLLEPDKISLRMTVPWNPTLNVGKTIRLDLKNKPKTTNSVGNGLNYGSGKYLITSLIHNIKAGGFSTTTVDCISQTAATNGVI